MVEIKKEKEKKKYLLPLLLLFGGATTLWYFLTKKVSGEETMENLSNMWQDYQCITAGYYPSDIDIPEKGVIALPKTPADIKVFDISTYVVNRSRLTSSLDDRCRIKKIADNFWAYNYEDEDIFPHKIADINSPTGYYGNNFREPSLLVGIVGNEIWIKVLCYGGSFTNQIRVGGSIICEIIGGSGVTTNTENVVTINQEDVDTLPTFKYPLADVPLLREGV